MTCEESPEQSCRPLLFRKRNPKNIKPAIIANSKRIAIPRQINRPLSLLEVAVPLTEVAGIVIAVDIDSVLSCVGAFSRIVAGKGDARQTEDAGAMLNISTPVSLQQLAVAEPQQFWPSEQVQI